MSDHDHAPDADEMDDPTSDAAYDNGWSAGVDAGRAQARGEWAAKLHAVTAHRDELLAVVTKALAHDANADDAYDKWLDICADARAAIAKAEKK